MGGHDILRNHADALALGRATPGNLYFGRFLGGGAPLVIPSTPEQHDGGPATPASKGDAGRVDCTMKDGVICDSEDVEMDEDASEDGGFEGGDAEYVNDEVEDQAVAGEDAPSDEDVQYHGNDDGQSSFEEVVARSAASPVETKEAKRLRLAREGMRRLRSSKEAGRAADAALAFIRRPHSTRPREGTYQHDAEAFAFEAHEMLRDVRTDRWWQTVIAAARISSTRSKVQVLEHLSEVFRKDPPNCAPDLYVADAPGEANEDSLDIHQVVFRMIDKRQLPIWVEGTLWKEGRPSPPVSASFLLGRIKDHGLKGRRRTEAEVWDGGLGFDDQNPRPTTKEELLEHILRNVPSKSPLNWLNIGNKSGVKLTPPVIELASIDHLSGQPAHESEWIIASTAGSISTLHRDSMGFLTWVQPLKGSKTWYVAASNFEGPTISAEAFEACGPMGLPPGAEFVAKDMDASKGNGLWIQGPGQLHWVHTNESSLFVGGHFLTAAHFHLSVKLVFRYLKAFAEVSNEDANRQDFRKYTQLFRVALNDDSVFSEARRALVRQAVAESVNDKAVLYCPLHNWASVKACPANCGVVVFLNEVKAWYGDWEDVEEEVDEMEG